MTKAVLGISAFYHDSAAALIVDGKIVAAASEERFTRKKYDASFPLHACRYVLDEAGLPLDAIDAVGFYDKPLLKFERLLETYHSFAPRGLKSFLSAMPVWIKEKLFLKKLLRNGLEELGEQAPPLFFPEHHLSHAASAFYPSPFEEAAVLTLDGVGEWATTTLCHARGSEIEVLLELRFPHSLGLLYSAFTQYAGFRVNSGEYKLMGLAPYGDARSAQVARFRDLILEQLIDLRADGSFLLNMRYFDFATELHMCEVSRWQQLFGIPPRAAEGELSQDYMNLALAIQLVTEEVIFRLARTARERTGSKQLALAGGVALNCVANGKLERSGIFEKIWVQPAAGDAGGALGAALATWHIGLSQPRAVPNAKDSMNGAYLGPSYSNQDVQTILARHGANAERISELKTLCDEVARLLCEGRVVGWFQGRMEWGPRALGNRSILGDPRHPEMQKRLNLKIKQREGFRPFAPAVLAEDLSALFELEGASPYMQFVANVREPLREPVPDDYDSWELFRRLYFVRSQLPAITHVDYSARVQTVHHDTNPRFWQLLQAFKQKTSFGVLVNTSFNVRGEPIVCTPDDAYRCFMGTDMDCLVLNDFLLHKSSQPGFGQERWRREFEKD
jgi:carbamoyltransferase